MTYVYTKTEQVPTDQIVRESLMESIHNLCLLYPELDWEKDLKALVRVYNYYAVYEDHLDYKAIKLSAMTES